MNKMKNFIVFWLGQGISQLGSSMTSFALTIWVFKQTNSAMSVSLLAFCSYLPYVLVSIFAGSFVDKFSKKTILIISDTIAAICTISIVVAIQMDSLTMLHIYLVNSIVGFMHAYQSPSASIITGLLAPSDEYGKVSGLNSLSNNLITVASPVFAGMFMAFGGLKLILIIDLLSFFFAMSSLLIVIIKEPIHSKQIKGKPFAGIREGWSFLIQNKGILYIMFSLAMMNFFSRLTYENILSAMILSRSNGNMNTYGIVSGVLGVGGILGGLWVSFGKKNRNPIKLIYFSAAISFLLGDLLMGVGQNIWMWCIAGVAASFPIPLIVAGQNVILYKKVLLEMQGRIFSIRNAIQFSTIPVGILLGGYLADYIFEPFMLSGRNISFLQALVGKGAGSGMAVMFICTGILGCVFSCLCYKNKQVQSLQHK